tara:strand:+ start:1904 stop:2686 length:783 start_codon:yes stop_codon:yes gene_type:complete
MNMDKIFSDQVDGEIIKQKNDEDLKRKSMDWFLASCRHNYSYHFEWMGRPIIQYPQDIVALQEIIWRTRPDLIVECGVARGGSLVFNASMLALIDYCDMMSGGKGGTVESYPSKVIGIDIDIRSHNRAALDAHPLQHKIDLVEGSSIDGEVVAEVRSLAKAYSNIMVILDSNHTHDHVLEELRQYAGLVGNGNYCVVLDTVIEHMPKEMHENRSWGPGNSPKSAVDTFLEENNCFEVDEKIDDKLLISVGRGGYLKRVKS